MSILATSKSSWYCAPGPRDVSRPAPTEWVDTVPLLDDERPADPGAAGSVSSPAGPALPPASFGMRLRQWMQQLAGRPDETRIPGMIEQLHQEVPGLRKLPYYAHDIGLEVRQIAFALDGARQEVSDAAGRGRAASASALRQLADQARGTMNRIQRRRLVIDAILDDAHGCGMRMLAPQGATWTLGQPDRRLLERVMGTLREELDRGVQTDVSRAPFKAQLEMAADMAADLCQMADIARLAASALLHVNRAGSGLRAG